MAVKNEILDNGIIDNHEADYTFSHGLNFGLPTRIVSWGIILVMCNSLYVSILNFSIVGIVISIIVLSGLLYLTTSKTGVQLCVRTKYIRMYTSYLGIKYGKWKTTRNYTDISILTIRKNVSKGSAFGTNTLTVEKVDTGVYLLIPSHRKRHLLTVCNSKAEADDLVNELCDKLNKKNKIFSPQISEASKARRYR